MNSYQIEVLHKQGSKSHNYYESDYNFREQLVRKYAWAIPDDEAIKELVKLSPIFEVGAGNGYWAKLIAEAGGTVICYDICVPEETYFPVYLGGSEVVSKIGVDYDNCTLFLCWPPYNDSMASDCLKLYTGNKLVYIGEGYDGCTGDKMFHRILDKDWQLTKVIQLTQWQNIHDVMYIHERIVT
jgi:SAM-dependent methyltransferase